MSGLEEFFGKPVFVYTRAQAIEDGVLVDVSRFLISRDGKSKAPPQAFCISQAAYADAVTRGHSELEDSEINRRVGNIVYALMIEAVDKPRENQLFLHVDLNSSSPIRSLNMLKLKAIMGQDDDGNPAVTVMLPNED